MQVRIVSTTNPRSKKGNKVTAQRWAGLLRELGHRVKVEPQYEGGRCDLLIALHARRSFPSVERFLAEGPERPLVLALTGTDLYQDIRVDPIAKRALELATRLVTLQPLALRELPRRLRHKARPIFQSAVPPRRLLRPDPKHFDVCVLGHLREVKDPFRAAEAARLLPESSRIRVVHVGAALSREMEERAQEEARSNPRYLRIGELTRGRALQQLSRCRLLALTSLSEGGANVIAEAIACRVPVVSSRIPGSIGLLGERYPGYFEPEDSAGLARLLLRAETDAAFYRRLARECDRLRPLTRPRAEREAWARLLAELPVPRRARRVKAA